MRSKRARPNLGRVAVLEVRGIVKRFRTVTAVDGISFTVDEGEIVGLLGPNGAGKTTTLHMVLGLTAPDEGSISIFGRDLAKHRTEVLSRVNFSASYVSLPAVLRVDEVLNVFAHMYGLREPARRVAETIELLDLGALRRKQFRDLSSGQMTRVHLAKALLNEPGLLVLDEPTANLDPDVGDRVRELLMELAERSGRAMLITSHNMREVPSFGGTINYEAFIQGLRQTGYDGYLVSE